MIQFARRLLALLLVSAILSSCSNGADEQQPGGNGDPGPATPVLRPHIIYIVADDLGWKDVGFHGAEIRTPNIDALAAGGAKFDQFYTQSMCTQSRAALMTGRYPLRYGLQTAVIPDSGTYSLPLDEWLLPQALKEAGYRTDMVGKWHLGHAKQEFWPRQRGFDSHYGSMIGEIDYYSHETHHITDWYRENAVVKEEGYATTLFGADAVRVINGHDPKTPLFMYLAFNAPHAPFQAPQDIIDSYKDIEDPTRRTYAAMVTAMDAEIGKVLAALEKRGMRKDTLIVFHSDNGGCRDAKVSGNVDTSKIKLPADNGPYRAGKSTSYEGGTRVVGLINWPDRIPAGSTLKGPMHIVDMYPTLLALAGGKLGKNKPLDGLDQWNAISAGAKSPRTEVVYNVELWGGSVRQGDWKLVWKATLPSKIELFDIAADPSEKNNLADRHPEVVARLQQRVEVLARESVMSELVKLAAGVVMKALVGSGPIFPPEVEEK